jgi:hypothetical protein
MSAEDRKNALMRFSRKGAGQLRGEALKTFNKPRSAQRTALFELFLSKGEDFEAINVSFEQMVHAEEKDKKACSRGWRSRAWILLNKYHGDETATDNACASKERTPGQSRLDPDGSGQMEYLVILDEKMEHEDINKKSSTLRASASVGQEAVQDLMRGGGLFNHGGGLCNHGDHKTVPVPFSKGPQSIASSLHDLHMGTPDVDARVKELEEELRRKDAERQQKEDEEKLKKEEQKRKKKEEAERRREEQKGDPIFQAKQFGKQLLNDIVQCKELVGRLAKCGELAAEYVKALSSDEGALDKSYNALQVAINAKDMELLAEVMKQTVELATEHHKRFRMAKGQVQELEKMEKEKEKAAAKGK